MLVLFTWWVWREICSAILFWRSAAVGFLSKYVIWSQVSYLDSVPVMGLQTRLALLVIAHLYC